MFSLLLSVKCNYLSMLAVTREHIIVVPSSKKFKIFKTLDDL